MSRISGSIDFGLGRMFLLLCLQVVLVSPAPAGTQSNAKVALHARPGYCDFGCGFCTTDSPNGYGIACSAYRTEAPLWSRVDLYLVVAQADPGPGIAGLSCGIEYDGPQAGEGIAIFAWTLCADLDFPNGNWPLSGGGDRVTWNYADNCQRFVLGEDGVHAIAGWLYTYAYGPGELRVTPNRNLESGPELTVADCAAAETDLPLDHAGSVFFSDTGDPGCNPCLGPCTGPVPVERTTWGGIKSRSGN